MSLAIDHQEQEATYVDHLRSVIADVVEPNAVAVDTEPRFPDEAVAALARTGLLGLTSAKDVNGMGLGMREAAHAIKQLGAHCGSTAMVVTMHYAAAAVLEAHASLEARRAAADGTLATLAFSEAGSRSQFWAPVSTATRIDGGVRLDAKKSWVTSAGAARLYVWSSRPVEADGASTIWLLTADAPGLSAPVAFDGLGLRGNASSPICADGVVVGEDAMLGPDGGGFDVMMGVVLPIFCVLSAACCSGLMDAATTKAAEHAAGTRFDHLGSSLADLPTVRAYLARMRVETDKVWSLTLDTLDALETGREDALLRVLEVKAAAGESATMVTDLAMRVCGGAAFRKEVGVERLFRDARAATVMAPTTDVLYDFIGKAVTGLPLF